ncbi:MAG: phospholipase D-like domain-containing protein [Thermoproteus sp.]
MRAILLVLMLSSIVIAQALNICPNAVIVGPQNATEIASYISKAQKAVYIETYALTWRDLAQTLVSLAQRGVEVYVVLSGNVYGGIPTTEKQLAQYLKDNGVNVAFNYDFKYVHTKAFVIDNKTVILGSINPTYSGVTSDIGLDVVINNSTLAQEVASIILNDYMGVYPDYDYPGVVISPVNSYNELSWLLNRPGRAYAAVEEVYSSSGLADTLMSKAEVVLARVTDVQGVETINDLTAKVIVVGDYVYVGSVNLSGNSINNNRELGLVLYCPLLAEAARSLILQWAGSAAGTISASSTSSAVSYTTAATTSQDLITLVAIVLLALLIVYSSRRKRRRP